MARSRSDFSVAVLLLYVTFFLHITTNSFLIVTHIVLYNMY